MMPSENSLAMVLRHEIADLKLRHPIANLGRGLVLGVTVGAVSAAAGGDVDGRILGNSGMLTALPFSRSQESAGDLVEGLAALARVYGHVAGADEVFRVLQREFERLPAQPPAFLRTHPLDATRVDAARTSEMDHAWGLTGEHLPIPEGLSLAVLADKR